MPPPDTPDGPPRGFVVTAIATAFLVARIIGGGGSPLAEIDIVTALDDAELLLNKAYDRYDEDGNPREQEPDP